MPTIDLQLARQRLETMLAEKLKPDREALSEHIRMSNEENDNASAIAQTSVAAGVANAAVREKDIRWALQRIEEGTYHICFDCEEEIAPGRLKAMPATRLCVNCQEIFDQMNSRGQKHSRDPRPTPESRPEPKGFRLAWSD